MFYIVATVSFVVVAILVVGGLLIYLHYGTNAGQGGAELTPYEQAQQDAAKQAAEQYKPNPAVQEAQRQAAQQAAQSVPSTTPAYQEQIKAEQQNAEDAYQAYLKWKASQPQ